MIKSRYNVVADHVKELVQPITDDLIVQPKSTLSDREYTLFWKYHGRFPNDFAKGIMLSLPKEYQFVSYDHLKNVLTATKTKTNTKK